MTGQQVGLFGGPLFTPFKAATALARARQATACGSPHAAIFWLATEDHDFAEIDHVVFPARRELRKLVYSQSAEVARPVGGIVLDDSITPLIDQARELLGASEAMEALAAAYEPGRTFAQAFREFYSKAFAAQGLLVLDAGGRAAHRMGAPVLRAAIERADELLFDAARPAAGSSESAGYHAQVAVAPQSSLLFLIDDRSGARVALKRQPSSARTDGLWQAGRAELFDRRIARHPRRGAGAHLALGAAAARLSGFFALYFGYRRRTGGDRLLCPIRRALRADSRARRHLRCRDSRPR